MVAATVASPGDGSGQITKSPGISRFMKNVFGLTKHGLKEDVSNKTADPEKSLSDKLIQVRSIQWSLLTNDELAEILVRGLKWTNVIIIKKNKYLKKSHKN